MYDLLSGLSIIEASSFVASPSAGLYCAQLGAEVIRVDNVGGGLDYDRYMLTREGRSLSWENLNRAKKSVALDLASGEGRELLVELVGNDAAGTSDEAAARSISITAPSAIVSRSSSAVTPAGGLTRTPAYSSSWDHWETRPRNANLATP